MISASASKLIRSLRYKKYRQKNGLYVAEGEKLATELLRYGRRSGHRIRHLFATAEWSDRNRALIRESKTPCTPVSREEIGKVSFLVSPRPVLALVEIPVFRTELREFVRTPVLGFDAIRDPGNLGTIMRTADWFGIRHLVCSPDSVDAYNPKVVQSTMGAIARVQVHYLDLDELMNETQLAGKPALGTQLEGEDLFAGPLEKDPLILFGNESRGLPDRLVRRVDRRIRIPSFQAQAPEENAESGSAESLNLAASVAIICAELRRNP